MDTSGKTASGHADNTHGGRASAVVSAAAMPFVSFCLECYKARHGLTGGEVAALFRQYGVEKYLYDEYDILHSFGERQILDYIDRFIDVRKETKP